MLHAGLAGTVGGWTGLNLEIHLMAKTLHRRTVLRGIGTAIALPWLEAMSPGTITRTARAAARTSTPTRLAFLFVPNGVHAPEWLPTPGNPGVSPIPADLPPFFVHWIGFVNTSHFTVGFRIEMPPHWVMVLVITLAARRAF